MDSQAIFATLKFDKDQPRDKDGQFASVGGASLASGVDRADWPDHIKALKVPPAWTDVRINPNPDASLMVVGKDSKGRDQYVYSQDFVASQAAQKFERISELHQEMPQITEQLAKARNSEATREHADCAYLIMKTGIRPGSEEDTQAAQKAYGATTLTGNHVVVKGGEVRLQFVGKKGVGLDIPVTDHGAAVMLKRRKREAGAGQLFPGVSDASLREFVHSRLDAGHFKPKDFRTHLGTATAKALVDSMDAPKTQKAYRAQVKAVATKVSRLLGNTPTVALQSYIAPQVFAKWRINVS
jgi:DNA topoisomerase I